MKTVFVSGSDTNVGKTWVVGSLAALLSERGHRVQIVKPIETGVSDPSSSDSQVAASGCVEGLVTAQTLMSFPLAIAPVAAAAAEGVDLRLSMLVDAVTALPKEEWRIVEGAGSLASPIDVSGADWADFARELGIDRTVLVVEDRVGAIGQARMLHAYATSRGVHGGIWLNEVKEQSQKEREGTRNGIRSLEIPLWATQRKGAMQPELLEEGWL